MISKWFHFSEASAFKVSGKDARRYLQNRLSNDVRSLAAGQSAVAGVLTPQGRVEALCAVFSEQDDVFYLAYDGGNRQAIFAALGRFIVADRVSIEDLSKVSAYAHLCGVSIEEAAGLFSTPSSKLFIRSSDRLGLLGVDLLCIGDGASTLLAKLEARYGSPFSPASFEALRLKQGSPVFPVELNEGIILTEAGLKEAVSFSKGCYVGQEVIERSEAIGRLPRHLERVALRGQAQGIPGSVITNTNGEVIGKAVSSAYDPESGQTFGFALLRTGNYAVNDTIVCCGLQGSIIPR